LLPARPRLWWMLSARSAQVQRSGRLPLLPRGLPLLCEGSSWELDLLQNTRLHLSPRYVMSTQNQFGLHESYEDWRMLKQHSSAGYPTSHWMLAKDAYRVPFPTEIHF
jgi:hypothetical protein